MGKSLGDLVKKYEKDVVEQIVDPINKKIKELYG